MRLVYVVTHEATAKLFLSAQADFFRTNGLDVYVVHGGGSDNLSKVMGRSNERYVFQVPMHRDISVLRDLKALFSLYWLFRKIRPTIVNASTPKASLLGILAAFAARVPVRIYTLRGLRLEGTKGWKRRILSMAEGVTSSMSTRVFAVSRSLADEYVHYGFSRSDRIKVLCNGSSNGVDFMRFSKKCLFSREIHELRERLGIRHHSKVVGYVGRLTRDKGVEELERAFSIIRAVHPDTSLLLVGDFEVGDMVSTDCISRLAGDDGVIKVGFVEDTSLYYNLMKVMIFPSKREGFPNVPLEAAAAGIPTVGFAATGTVDAIVNERTGLLVPLGDVEALAGAVCRYLEDEDLLARHGAAAQARVRAQYRPELIWEALLSEYRELVAAKGLI